MDVTLPSGQIIKGVPDGTTKEQLRSKLESSGIKIDKQPEHKEEPSFNAIERGAAERMLGAEELINNLGVGKHIGLPSNEILEGANKIAEEQGKQARQGEGTLGKIGSFIGEQAGDPVSWLGGSELKGAEGALNLAKAGGKYGVIAGGTETGSKNIGENIEKAGIGGAAGSLLTPAIPAVGKKIGGAIKTVGEGFSARSSEELKAAAESIRNESDSHYDVMRSENAYISPESFQKLQKDVAESLSKQGLWNKRLHGDTMSVLSDLEKAGKNGISIESLDQHRRLLSAVYNKNRLSNPEDAKKAISAISEIDNVIDKLEPKDLSTQSTKAVDALKNARSTWAKARKFEVVSDIIEKANGDPNRMKQLFEQLANNKNKTRGWSEEEKKALREAASNTTTEGLLKMAGKFGIHIGEGRSAGTGNVLPAAEVLVAGTKKGIPVVLGGTIAKQLQKLPAKAKAEKLLKLIEKGEITPEQALGATYDPLKITINPDKK